MVSGENRGMRRRLASKWGLAGALAMCCGVPGFALAELLTHDVSVRQFVADMQSRHGFSTPELESVLRNVEILPGVLEAISRPAEGKPWYQYRSIFLTPGRVSRGITFWRSHEDALKRAEKTFGVRPEIIVAIIGVETFYGERAGATRVLDALATLAFFYPRRSEFFRNELEHFFLLLREEGLSPFAVKGSYAGAMGIPQFISSSYRRYAIDFDGDRARDLLNSPVDAIGSVANYLSEHGWRPGEDIAIPVTVSGEEYKKVLDRGLKPSTSLAEIKRLGVETYGAGKDSASGALIEFELEDGVEYWVGMQNFYTITRYNHSALYAMAVFQLAQSIREEFRSTDG